MVKLLKINSSNFLTSLNLPKYKPNPKELFKITYQNPPKNQGKMKAETTYFHTCKIQSLTTLPLSTNQLILPMEEPLAHRVSCRHLLRFGITVESINLVP